MRCLSQGSRCFSRWANSKQRWRASTKEWATFQFFDMLHQWLSVCRFEMDSVQQLCRPPAVFWELEEAALGHWNRRGTVVPMVVNHFRSFASHVPQEKQYQKANHNSAESLHAFSVPANTLRALPHPNQTAMHSNQCQTGSRILQ